ncbi:Zinc finger protein 2 [Folsomia candida]|uniref:Zinc finger protein 2 n=1 Tax=Folsomia candida TaxID=158441 RepID=A0A226DUG1_FOLCA|nr:Zinc finger protein 2 [Folsomia candida]
MATGRNSSFGYIFIAGQVDGQQRQNPIYRDPLRFLGCFFLVFKEPVKRSPLSLNVMFIVSLQILASHYEYFFTARLIIPPHFKELSTLKEFIDEGFVLLYEEDVDYGVVREEYLILEDLKIQGIPSEIFNNSFQPVRQVGTINDLLKFISPDLEHRKNVYYGSVNYQEMFRIGTILHLIKHIIFLGKYLSPQTPPIHMDLKPGKKWDCSKCSETFKTKNGLTRHMITHDPDAKVKCEVCGKVSKNRRALNLHKWRLHTQRNRPSCDTCHRVFFDSNTLRLHINMVHSTRERPRFPCTFPSCGKTFLNKGHVVRHVQTDHAENPIQFPCTLCGKDFKRRHDLDNHIATHTTEKTHNCATCGRSFARRRDMKSHENTHLERSARTVFECHLCTQAFLNKRDLHPHIRVVHENQRNYPCESCDTRFSYLIDLKRHVEAKHAPNREQIHSCDKCKYRSHSRYYLAAHARRHKPARHACYFCGEKSITFQDLVQHSSRNHTL